jgi:tetratricopeptide (TPR) repeat protein
MQQNRTQNAIEYFNQGLEIEPNHEMLLIEISEAYKKGSLFDQAIAALEKLASIRENRGEPDTAIYYNIAQLYKERSMPTEALAALNKALAIDADFESGHKLYSEITYENNMFEQAIDHLIFITNLRPDDDESARRLAISYQRTGQLNRAIDNYRAIISRDPNNLRAYQNLAAAYRTMATDNTAEASRFNRLALQEYLNAKKLDDNSARIEISLSDVYLALGELQNAEKFANSAKQKQSNLHEASTILGTIAQRRGIEKYNAYLDLQTKTDSGNFYGKELDNLTTQRDRTKTESHNYFNQADRFFKEALAIADNDRVKSEITQRIQGNVQYINQSKPDFFE